MADNASALLPKEAGWEKKGLVVNVDVSITKVGPVLDGFSTLREKVEHTKHCRQQFWNKEGEVTIRHGRSQVTKCWKFSFLNVICKKGQSLS